MEKRLPVGVQLYSVRDVLEAHPEQFETFMQQIAGYGYTGVELAGLYGLKPEVIRDTLRKVGLTPISAHVPLVDMIANPEQVAKDYRLIGCDYIVVPYLPEEFRPFTQGYITVIRELQRIGKIMKEHGVQMLYHNHDFEFVRLPNQAHALDDIYTQVPPEALAAELDTCWIKVAGEDPVVYINKYAGRCPVVHLKDFIKEGNPKNLYKLIGIDSENSEEDTGLFEFRAVGFGQQIWQPILEASATAGAQWVVVEQDEHYDIPSMECIRRSREYLKIFGW